MIRTSAAVITHTEPHKHHTGQGLIAPEDLRRLNAELPDERLFFRGVKEAPEFDKHYRFWGLNAYLSDEWTPQGAKLPAAWSELVTEVVQAPFRDWLSEVLGLSLRGAPQDVMIMRRGPGDYRSLHRGKAERATNIVLCLNEEWPEGGGGTYDLWASKDADGPVRSIVPVPGSMYTVIHSDASWHRVTPVREHVPAPLLTLALGFSKPDAR